MLRPLVDVDYDTYNDLFDKVREEYVHLRYARCELASELPRPESDGPESEKVRKDLQDINQDVKLKECVVDELGLNGPVRGR